MVDEVDEVDEVALEAAEVVEVEEVIEGEAAAAEEVAESNVEEEGAEVPVDIVASDAAAGSESVAI